jgi:DNA-binding transcriptional regulator PaaX
MDRDLMSKRGGGRNRFKREANRAVLRLKREYQSHAEDRERAEDGEWRMDVADMTEMDRAATQYDVRRADGLSGDREDV